MSTLSKVNILQGTASSREFSRGNTLPLIARPWGMHHWTPQTNDGPWLFHPDHRKLHGMRLTHRPSPWMGDYGGVLISAFHGTPADDPEGQASAWRREDGAMHPNVFRAELLRYGIRMEMSPANRGAVFVFTTRRDEPLKIRFWFDGDYEVRARAGERGFDAESRHHAGGVSRNFGLRLFGEFDATPVDIYQQRNGASFIFPASVRRLTLRIAGSFIDAEMAREAHNRELAGHSLESMEAEGRDAWESLLGRLDIEGFDGNQEKTFYSCLYHALLFPRFLDERDVRGRMRHYSPYDGEIHEGTLCADNGFWDTFRTLYPLLILAYPEVMKRMLEGWLNACHQLQWTPKWANPGAHDCMIGTHLDVIVADAVAKSLTEWDVEGAFSYLWKNATVPSDDGRFGRRGLEEYIRLGYVAADRTPYAVSRTLDYCFNDFCVAQVADFLGRHRQAAELRRRTGNYRNVFDPDVHFMRGRLSSGAWLEPFDEYSWGGPYVEGGAWQHSFNVPHDPAGLAALYGGPGALCRKLDRMLGMSPRFDVGTYGIEIHEMTEMAFAGFGQYAHSNQPVHNYLFLYGLCGEWEKTESWVRRVTDELYSPEFLPGDEDNGEMSAWYVFSSLGLYPFCPGKPEYLRFSPLVRRAAIRRHEGEILLTGEGKMAGLKCGGVTHQALLAAAEGRPSRETVRSNGAPVAVATR